MIHILCPFYRKHLLKTLISYLDPMNIIWHPICDPIDYEPFKFIDKYWIKPFLVKPLKIPGDQAFRKINDFIEGHEIINEDYYGFMGDDDMFEPDFFDIIREQTAKILFFSNYRGNSVPNDKNAEPHPVYPLIIKALNDVRVYNIGFGMYIIKGEILRQTRFGNTQTSDDGRYAEMLKNTWPHDCKCLPNSFIFGNYFQPGRFTSKEKFIKKTWELPIIK